MAILSLEHSRINTARGDIRDKALLWVAAALILASIFLPYWSLTLNAPQYPGGLHVHVYVNKMVGDVAEIDGLNHYIGMRPLDEAAQLERRISIPVLVAFALLIVAASFIRRRWAFLLVIPALVFPIVFMVDLWYWMRLFGQNLDPTAALSSSIKPFTPTVLGTGIIAQFSTVARLDQGFYMAMLANLLVAVAFVIRRRETREASA
jgi:hypothetical protein